jgi:hypothetical protein
MTEGQNDRGQNDLGRSIRTPCIGQRGFCRFVRLCSSHFRYLMADLQLPTKKGGHQQGALRNALKSQTLAPIYGSHVTLLKCGHGRVF